MLDVITGAVIAAEAVRALDDPQFVETPGCCQMYAREVAEAVGGDVESVMDAYRTGTAAGTLDAFRGTPYLLWDRSSGHPLPEIQEGDFLYKGPDTCRFISGAPDPDGHVGIAVNGRRIGLGGDVAAVCENSSYHARVGSEPGRSGRVQGAKGWRTLPAFGDFTGLVRLA